MNIEVPDGTVLYIFGSALHSPTPADLDVLVVYDPARVPPAIVHDRMQPTFLTLQMVSGLSVHPTLLTLTEAKETCFLERFGCVEAAVWYAGAYG